MTKSEENAVRRVLEGYAYGYAVLMKDVRVAEDYGFVRQGGELTAKGKKIVMPLRAQRDNARASERDIEERKAVRRVAEGYLRGHAVLVKDSEVARRLGFTKNHELTAKGRAFAERLGLKASYDDNPTRHAGSSRARLATSAAPSAGMSPGKTAAIVGGVALLGLGLYAFLSKKPAAAGPVALKTGAVVGKQLVTSETDTTKSCLPYSQAIIDSFAVNSLYVVRPIAAGEKAVGELSPFGLTSVPDPNKNKVGSSSPSGPVYSPQGGVYPKANMAEAVESAKAQRAAEFMTKTPRAVVVTRNAALAPCAGGQKLTFSYVVVWSGEGMPQPVGPQNV